MEDFPRIVQMLTKPFINPYYFRFRAKMNVRINIENTEDRITAEGIYELMLLSEK